MDSSARFSVDENALPVGRALAQVRRDVVHPGHPLLPEVALGTDDVTWLAIVARQGLLTLTWDTRIRYRRAELRTCLDAGGRIVFFTGGNRTMFERLALVLRAWPQLEEVQASEGPLAKTWSNGRLRDVRDQ